MFFMLLDTLWTYIPSFVVSCLVIYLVSIVKINWNVHIDQAVGLAVSINGKNLQKKNVLKKIRDEIKCLLLEILKCKTTFKGKETSQAKDTYEKKKVRINKNEKTFKNMRKKIIKDESLSLILTNRYGKIQNAYTLHSVRISRCFSTPDLPIDSSERNVMWVQLPTRFHEFSKYLKVLNEINELKNLPRSVRKISTKTKHSPVLDENGLGTNSNDIDIPPSELTEKFKLKLLEAHKNVILMSEKWQEEVIELLQLTKDKDYNKYLYVTKIEVVLENKIKVLMNLQEKIKAWRMSVH